jgi:transglutaminase-like putative cysteine protease
VPGATDVSTPDTEVLADRRGVGQDFAHLLLGALRSVGLGVRDDTDVVPVRGVVFGPPAEHQLTVSVDVAPV